MAPTETALQLLGPATDLLHEADRLFGAARARSAASSRRPASATFRIAASDYLDPLFLPELVAQLKRLAPQRAARAAAAVGRYDYRRSLATGEVDLVIGNWLEPPGELHLGRLIERRDRLPGRRRPPAVRSAARAAGRAERYLACEHVAPTPLHARRAAA